MSHPLIARLRADLASEADPSRAPQMQRYMKSAMPFRGVAASVARGLYRKAVADFPLADRDVWERTVRELYDDAAYREERYAAIAVLRSPAYRSWLDADVLHLVEHLVRTGAWWDLVDEASGAVGSALLADPDESAARIRAWAYDEVLWVRRTAIICQRTSREATDRELLSESIEASIGDGDFFARKAIGWALREYSKTDAQWVSAFVQEHPDLSALSRREAPRWLANNASADHQR